MRGWFAGDARRQRPSRGRLLLWLLVVLGGLGLGLGVRRLMTAGPHYSDDPRLQRAAEALLRDEHADGRKMIVNFERPTPVPPVSAYLDRERLVELALGIGGYMELKGNSAEHLADALKVQTDVARLLVAALGRLGSGPPPSLLRELEAFPPSGRPALLSLAADAPAWAAARQALETDHGLSREQLLAVRAELCARALERAFDHHGGAEQAREALGKYGALIPEQREAVLAMAGALELSDAGRRARPALERVGKRHPDLARLLRRSPSAGSGGAETDPSR